MTSTFAIMESKKLDWNSLKTFLAIVRNGNLVEASQSLGISHSTVFRRLNTFETEVGGRLFERLDGNYELTEMGDELLLLSQPILDSFDNIERHLIGKDMRPQGTVKITAPSSFSYYCLPRYIEDFSTLYPDINIELLVSDLELNMTNRHADIAIRVTSSPAEHLVGRQVNKIKWGVYASKGYISKYGRPVESSNFDKHRLIGAAKTLKSVPAFLWLDKKHAKNIVHRTDDFIAMSHLAGAGLGIAFLPDELKHPKIERLFTFKPAGINTLWVLTHPDLRKVERIKLVMQYLAMALSEDKFSDS